MAVKFSEFTQKSDATASSITEIVGYLSSGQLNVRVVPSALDTTYTFATTNGATPALTLAGTKAGETIADTLVTLSSTNATVLTGSGTNAISIDSTKYALSATDNADPAVNTPVVLTGTGGGDVGDDTVNIIGSGTVGVTSSSGTITINGTGGGTFTSFDITGNTGTTETVTDGQTVTIAGGTLMGTVGSSADTITVNHDSVTRSDTTSSDSPSGGGTVDLVKTITTSTEGHVTAVDVSTVTWPAAGGGFGSVTQTTGTGSSLGAITLGSTPAAAQNCLVSISGVTQNYLDASSVANWTVTSNTLTFAFNPPVTATNGIQITVIA